MEKIYNRQKEAKIDLPICIVSNQEVVFGSGLIELRKNSKTGELIESFDVNSSRVNISGYEILIQPSNSLPYETEIYVLISDGSILSKVNGSSFSGFDVNGDKEFKFTTENCLGKPLDGGIIISKEGGQYTIVSSKKHEMDLTWYELNKVIQKTTEDTGTTGWYVPSLYELQKYKEILNLKKSYWTSTENDNISSYLLNMNSNVPYIANKNESHLIILFKKVNY